MEHTALNVVVKSSPQDSGNPVEESGMEDTKKTRSPKST